MSDYKWPGDNKTPIERALSAEYELDKAVSEINALRAQLGMRNSDVLDLLLLLEKVLEFYDNLPAPTGLPESKLLDEVDTTIQRYRPTFAAQSSDAGQ